MQKGSMGNVQRILNRRKKRTFYFAHPVNRGVALGIPFRNPKGFNLWIRSGSAIHPNKSILFPRGKTGDETLFLLGAATQSGNSHAISTNIKLPAVVAALNLIFNHPA